ncbi:MAG: 50S ribosomal protein L6 [Verrucomicrobia bacterium]|nr:MAG: 50S ribosomal protein L6 [Verrucomicrobiota bacterium]
MSRIGRLPIPLPQGVKVEIQDRQVAVQGAKGRLQFDLPEGIEARVEDDRLVVRRADDTSKLKALHGLSRSILNNMVQGVSQGYVKRLEIHGVGFRAAVNGQEVTMQLGYSHEIKYRVPEGVTVKVEDQTKLTVEGPDKQKVGQVAADLRSFYPPEPYKGKGVRYADEQILRKEGKKVQ